jgi:hypothetical protein
MKISKRHLLEPNPSYLTSCQVSRFQRRLLHSGPNKIVTNQLWLCKQAFEFWDKDCIQVVAEKMMPGVQFPIASDKPYEFYALLETQGSRKEHDEAVMKILLPKYLMLRD